MLDTGERAKCPERNKERGGLNAEDAELKCPEFAEKSCGFEIAASK
jgi:hypothetical protein